MTRLVALLILLAGAAAPLAAQAHEAETGVPTSVPHEPTGAAAGHGQPAAAGDHAQPAGGHAAAAEGHAEEEGHGEFDAMHHVMDAHYIEVPWGKVDLPPARSWMVGPIDMTPTKHTVFLAIAGLLVIAIFVPAGLAARRRNSGLAPAGRHNAVEALALYFRDQVVMPNIGHGGEKFAPFLLTVFVFILFANLLGMLPWGSTATANIAVTAALAFISFVAIEAAGMRALGPMGYLKTIVYIPHGLPKPLIPVMALIMTPVELMGKLAKPFALAVRLMANMMAGHIVLLSLFAVGWGFGGFIIAGPAMMALALTFLEIFVAFLQAYVFTMLTSVFIGMIRHAH